MRRLILAIFTVSMLATTVWAQQTLPAPPTEAEFERLQAETQVLRSGNLECSGASGNLAHNASFEGQYSDYSPPGGHPDCPWGTCFSAQMAAGWTPYWRSHNPSDPGYIYVMPEYKPATSDFTNPVRVRSGARAQQWFSFWSTHQAGIYQRINNIEPGSAVCLSVWGHAWSSWQDTPFTNPAEHGFLNQQIGIDPTGGTNYLSPNVIWTSPVTQYDEYGLFRLDAVAEATSVTVFMHSEPLWAAKHNDVYWDDVVVTTDEAPEPPQMSVTPTWFGLSSESAVPLYTTVEPMIDFNRSNIDWQAQVLPHSDFLPTLSNSSGSGPQRLSIVVDSSGLNAGSHRATIEVKTDDPTVIDGTAYITVDLEILPTKMLRLSRHSFAYMSEAATARRFVGTVDVMIEGSDPASWTARSVGGSLPIELQRAVGAEGQQLAITVDSANLGPGRYSSQIEIDVADAEIESQMIEVTLIVAEQIYPAYISDLRLP